MTQFPLAHEFLTYLETANCRSAEEFELTVEYISALFDHDEVRGETFHIPSMWA